MEKRFYDSYFIPLIFVLSLSSFFLVSDASANSAGNYHVLVDSVTNRMESEGYIPLERSAAIQRNESTREAIILKRKLKKVSTLTEVLAKASGGTRSSDGRYTDNGDGTITDTKTGLMWTKDDSWNDRGGCLNWNDSKSYVSGLTKGGYTNWRLPTVSELKTIYEQSKENISGYKGDTVNLDPIFSKGGAIWYWSSQTAGSCCALGLLFSGGFVGKITRNTCFDGGVRAVRR